MFPQKKRRKNMASSNASAIIPRPILTPPIELSSFVSETGTIKSIASVLSSVGRWAHPDKSKRAHAMWAIGPTAVSSCAPCRTSLYHPYINICMYTYVFAMGCIYTYKYVSYIRSRFYDALNASTKARLTPKRSG